MKRALVLSAFLLGGCTVGPDYHAPDMAVPSRYAAAGPTMAGAGDLSQWWKRFNDPELDRLVDRALKSNPDLLTAASRVREAREQVIIAGAAGLPKVDANALAAHVHSGSSLSGLFGAPGGGGPPSGSSDIKLYSLGFDATWEIDVFGGVRRAVEAAGANTEAALWQMHDGEVTLSAEIAVDYFTLRATQARIALLTDEVRRQTNARDLIAARARAGFVTRLDVNQQNGLVSGTEADIPPLEAEVRAMEHAIAVLLGEEPEMLIAELDARGSLPPAALELPGGLPSELLRRRPDIRAAERTLAAATADVGVATADLYPKFDLIAALNVSSSHLSSLFSGSSLAEAGIGSVMWPVFNGGKIHANIRAKEEEAEQAYYAYQKTVLGAVQNVEDALVRCATDRQSVAERERAEAFAGSSARIAAEQYRASLVTYLNVLTAQGNDLAARDALAQARQVLATDQVSLFKALGGGWQEGS